MGRLDWRGRRAMSAAAESLVVCGLVLLAVYVLWDADFLRVGPWQPVVALAAGLTAYWTLQALGRDSVAFWLMASATALPHAVPAWSHNRIEWHVFLEFQERLIDDRSIYWDLTLFVVCLVVLIALHRIMGIKRLERRMLLQEVNPREKRMVVRHESLMVIGLLAAALLVAGLMVAVATVLSRYGGLLEEASLAIAILGGGAAFLLALTLLFWSRGLRDSHNEEGGIHPNTVEGS